MKLDAWLAAEDKTLEWLAEEIETSVGSASRMARGLQNIPLSTVARIEALTGGQVTAADLVAQYREAQSEAA